MRLKFWSFICLFALVAVSCAPEPEAEPVAALEQAASTDVLARALGFEAKSDWRSAQAELADSSVHSQGRSALQVTNRSGWAEIVSIPLPSLGVGPVKTISFDVMPPAPPPNPWWFGEVQLSVDAPSRGVYTRYLGRYDFATLTPGKFSTLSFAVPADTGSKLDGSYQDLTFRIVINGPAGARYVLDNMRINGRLLGPEPELASCHPFMRVLSSGDLRYELGLRAQQASVKLVTRKNGTESVQDITASGQQARDGTFTYASQQARAQLRAGDVMLARFELTPLAGGPTTFRPGPTAGLFGDALTYDPVARCLPIQDDDVDGIPNDVDPCPTSLKPEPGVCGCPTPDTDRDGDALPDCHDECPDDRTRFVKGDCGCGDAPAPVGTACDDGPCAGKNSCDALGQCGNALACAIPGTVGLPKSFALDDRIVMMVPNLSASWDDVEAKLPPSYERLNIGDAVENRVVAAQLKAHFGPQACAWTGAKVVSPGIIAFSAGGGDAWMQIWNDHEPRRNVNNSYLGFPSGQPAAGVTSGCVALHADGSWRVRDCSTPCAVLYERSRLSLFSTAQLPTVECADFPGVDCTTRDGTDDESCVPEADAFRDAPATEAAAESLRNDCNACLALGETNCAACTGMAAQPAPAASCFQQRVDVPATASACPIEPLRDPLPRCVSDSQCEAGEVCGVYSTQVGANGQLTACSPPKIDEWWIERTCSVEHVCGRPTVNCENNPPKPNEPACLPGEPCACDEQRVCLGNDPYGESDPTASPESDLGSTRFDPGPLAVALPEPPPDELPDDVPVLNATPEKHSWCKYATKLPEQLGATDTKKGKGGENSFVALDFDPNLVLRYKLDPLAQGDLDFHAEASAQFAAKATFSFQGKTLPIDIVDAQVAAFATRCRLSSVGKLEVFGTDFLPLLPEEVQRLSKYSLPEAAIADKCECAVAAFREIADRTKKAMRDTQELLSQYHQALRDGTSMNAERMCQTLMTNVPAGVPFFDCGRDQPTVEDLINLMNWHYERQFSLNAPEPLALKQKFPNLQVRNVQTPHKCLPHPKLAADPSVRIPEFSVPELALPPMPDLAGAQQELAALNDARTYGFEGSGCQGGQIRTEKRTLMTVNFALGPIPMLIEVEGVLKYGVTYDIKFTFNPQNLITNSPTRQDVAKVEAHATPCASAGIGLFVGAGFSGGGFKAAAGVEGMVNLITLSMPAHASASLQAAREQVSLTDPALHKLTNSDNKAVRFVSKELRKLWNGQTFPLYRQKVYFGYDYGASIVGDEFLKGKLSATATVKFWLFKKKWRTTLVNFPGLGKFDYPLLHGKYEDSAATGPFPMVENLDSLDAFVRFPTLSSLPKEFVGFRFADLRDALRSHGSAAFPGIPLSVPDLARVGLSLPDLTMIRVPEAELDALRVALRLEITLDEFKARIRAKSLDLSQLTLADFAKLDFGLGDFAAYRLSDDMMSALDLDLSQMIRLGFDFSGLNLGDLGLQPRPSVQSERDLDLTQVGGFYYDGFCRKPEPSAHQEEVVSLRDEGRRVFTIGEESIQRTVERTFARPIENYRVWIEQGAFDDKGSVLSSTPSLDPLHFIAPPQCGNNSPVPHLSTPQDISCWVVLAPDRRTLQFDLQTADHCGTWVGWSDVKVRYAVDFETAEDRTYPPLNCPWRYRD